jgi:hypothetical protein
MNQKLKFVLLLTLAIFLLTGAVRGNAAPYTMSDLDSTVTINPDGEGITDWTVHGRDYLKQQWFWYQIGSCPAEALGSAALPLNNQLVPIPNVSILNFANNDISVDMFLTLVGSSKQGSPIADLAEIVRVTNISGQELELSFYQFDDFDFGDPYDDVVNVKSENVIQQTDPAWQPSWALEVPVTTPAAHQVGDAAALLSAIASGAGLNGNTSLPSGADASFAYQWKKTLRPGDSLFLSKNKLLNPVPIPSSILLLLSGFLGVISIKRKRLLK